MGRNSSVRRARSVRAAVVLVLLGLGHLLAVPSVAAPKPPPFLGAWKTIGGHWRCTFNKDGTCAVGKDGDVVKARWREKDGTITVYNPDGDEYIYYEWSISADDKLTMTMLLHDGSPYGSLVLGRVKAPAPKSKPKPRRGR